MNHDTFWKDKNNLVFVKKEKRVWFIVCCVLNQICNVYIIYSMNLN